MSTSKQLLLLRDIADRTEPTGEDIQAVAGIVGRPLFARFFYGRAAGRFWADFAAREVLQTELDDEGIWLRLRFVIRTFESDAAQLLAVLNLLRPKIDRWMSREVVSAALRQSPENAWALRSFVLDSILASDAAIAPDVGSYLAHIAKVSGNDLQELLILVGSIVGFIPEPNQNREAAKKFGLNPVPRVDTYSYQQILEKGVRPLAKLYALGIAKTLADTLSDLMQLKVRPEGEEQEPYDSSRGWCADVAEPTSSHVDADESLVHTLTFACNLVYGQSDEPTNQIRTLDSMLRSQRWLVFNRIRLHLYAQHPKAAREWCSQFAREYKDYGQGTYPSDVAALLRRSSEQLGEDFLSKTERERIFVTILQSKRAEEFLKFTEQPETPDRLHKARFHQRQRDLYPFEPVLFGEARAAYDAALAESRAPAPTLESYELLGGGEAHSVEYRSPIPAPDLGALKDAELIHYLNTWNDSKRDEKEWWIETNLDGLSGAFKQCLTDNPDRFAKWGVRWRKLQRPRFIRTAIDFASEEISKKKFDHLPQWIGVVEWAATASRDDCNSPVGDAKKHGLSEWAQVRRNAVSFIGSCFDVHTPYNPALRRRFGHLVERFCTEPDPWLDHFTGTSEDPLTDAINTTRGRALEVLVQLAFWIRDDGKKPNHRKELRSVLALRFAEQPALSIAEYAQLGRLFPFIVALDHESAPHYRKGIFPPGPTKEWKGAISSLVLYAEAQKAIFEFVALEFDFVLNRLSKLREGERKGREFVPRFGQHLFLYYVWGCYDLTQNNDLLSRFYAVTKPEDWKPLMQFAGRILSNSKKISPEIQQRCEAFVSFRIAQQCALELDEFSAWLSAEAFPPRWRLQNLIQTLRLESERKRLSSLELKKLVPLLAQEPALTVEAFARLTSSGGTKVGFYFDAKDVWPILEAGFSSPDITTREWAEIAQNNLLEAGLFEYLEKTTAG
jgi:hypothetical protein